MNDQLPVKNKIESSNSFKIAPFRKHVRKTEPHKHNSYLEIIYLSEGSGYHTIDSIQHPIIPPLINLVRKEQVHYWELDTEPTGFVIIIKKEFLDKSTDKNLRTLLSTISAFNYTKIGDETTIQALFELILKEYAPGTNHNTPIIEGLLKALLAKIIDNAMPVQKVAAKKNTRIYESLLNILNQDKVILNNVAHYAEMLNTSPQNINAACRKAVGQPASEVLSNYIISEAKRLLLYTEMTISEIGQALDFKDNSHFTKYFKRYTSQTPNTFRKLS